MVPQTKFKAVKSALKHNDPSILISLLNDMINEDEEIDQQNILHVAVKKNLDEALKVLLKYQGSKILLNMPDSFDMTPIYYGLNKGSRIILNHLIQYNNHIDIQFYKNRIHKFNAVGLQYFLLYAMSTKSYELITFLLEHSELNISVKLNFTGDGPYVFRTPLTKAFDMGDDHMISLFLARQTLDSVKNKKKATEKLLLANRSFVHELINSNELTAAAFLLERNGILSRSGKKWSWGKNLFKRKINDNTLKSLLAICNQKNLKNAEKKIRQYRRRLGKAAAAPEQYTHHIEAHTRLTQPTPYLQAFQINHTVFTAYINSTLEDKRKAIEASKNLDLKPKYANGFKPESEQRVPNPFSLSSALRPHSDNGEVSKFNSVIEPEEKTINLKNNKKLKDNTVNTWNNIILPSIENRYAITPEQVLSIHYGLTEGIDDYEYSAGTYRSACTWWGCSLNQTYLDEQTHIKDLVTRVEQKSGKTNLSNNVTFYIDIGKKLRQAKGLAVDAAGSPIGLIYDRYIYVFDKKRNGNYAKVIDFNGKSYYIQVDIRNKPYAMVASWDHKKITLTTNDQTITSSRPRERSTWIFRRKATADEIKNAVNEIFRAYNNHIHQAYKISDLLDRRHEILNAIAKMIIDYALLHPNQDGTKRTLRALLNRETLLHLGMLTTNFNQRGLLNFLSQSNPIKNYARFLENHLLLPETFNIKQATIDFDTLPPIAQFQTLDLIHFNAMGLPEFNQKALDTLNVTKQNSAFVIRKSYQIFKINKCGKIETESEKDYYGKQIKLPEKYGQFLYKKLESWLTNRNRLSMAIANNHQVKQPRKRAFRH